MDIIAALDNEPNDTGGLTAEQLKGKFDEGGKAIKEYLNETVAPAIDQQEADAAALKKVMHTHSNKALLDNYAQTEENLADAVAKKHSHHNKDVLDSIAAATQELGAASDRVPSEAAVSDAIAKSGNLPGGGVAGQALVKKSDAAYDIQWDTLTAERVGAATAEDIRKNNRNPYKKVVIYGDSFTEGWTLDDPAADNWATKFAEMIGAETLYRYSNGGGGFIQLSHVTNLNFQDYFAQTLWPMLSSVADDIDLFIIQGGYNDQNQSVENEYAAVKSFLEDVHQKIPNAKIVGLTGLTYSNPYITTLQGIDKAFEELGFMNTKLAYSWMFGQEDYVNVDGIHPSAAGALHIAGKMAAVIRGGEQSHTCGEFISQNGFGIILRMTPFGLEYNISGTSTETAQSIYIATMTAYARPQAYTAFPCLSGGASQGYITIDAETGNLGFYHAAVEAIGTVRANFTLPFPFD